MHSQTERRRLYFSSASSSSSPSGDYFVSSSGNDSYSGTSPDSAWKTIGKVNSTGLSAGDSVMFKAGDTFTDTYLLIDSSGSKGNPIYFGRYGSGANPLFDMRTQVQGWVARGSIWKKYWNSHEVYQCFFNDVRGTEVASIASVDTTKKWHWASDTLYTYDTVYTIKVPYQVRGILSDAQDYIQIDSIDVYGAIHNGIGVETSSAHSWTIRGVRAKYNSMGIYFAGDTATISGCRTDHNGYYSQEHGIYIPGNNVTITRCQSDSNAGAGIHQWTGGSCTITRNKVFGNGTLGDDGWGIVVWQPDANTVCEISYNLVYDNTNYGIVVAYAGGGGKYRVYNNVVTGTLSDVGWYCGIFGVGNDATDSLWFKNNISYENSHGEMAVSGSGVYVLNYNSYYRADAGTMISYGGTEYTRTQFATYQSDKSQDANSINTNPTFTNALTKDFTLQSGSPCKDTGTNVGLSVDYTGNAVPYNTVVDMGAYEYGSSPPSTSIAFDASSAGDQISGATLTVSHTVGSDANWLEVGVATYLSGGGQTVTVQYNGTSMTARTAQGGEDKLQTFYLSSPTTGAHNIVVTPSSSSCEVALAAISLKNVSSTSNTNNETATNQNWTNTATVSSGNWSVVFLRTFNEDPTVTNGTERVANDNNATLNSIYCYTRESTGSTVQINGTKTAYGTWHTNGASINK